MNEICDGVSGSLEMECIGGVFRKVQDHGSYLELIRGEIDQGRSGGGFWEEGSSQECWDLEHGAGMDDL